jgi:hypothetical protein
MVVRLHNMLQRTDTHNKRLAAARARKARHRARMRRGERVFKLVANYELIVGGLIDAGKISERAALEHRKVEAVLSEWLTDWGRRWSRDL